MSWGIDRISDRWEHAPAKDYILGLDLGQAADYSALTMLDRVTTIDEGGWIVSRLEEPRYDLTQIVRLPLRTSYPKQVAYVRDVIRTIKAIRPEPNVDLVIDFTGVGRPVADMFLDADLDCRITLVTITGGDSVTKGADSNERRVPKRDLASAVRVLLETDRLRYAAGLPYLDELRKELTGFRVKISLKGHDSYGAGEDWRSAPHDDLVLSLALACWHGENRSSGWTPELMSGFAAWAADMGVG